MAIMSLTRCYWAVRCGDECQNCDAPEFEPNAEIVERSRSAVNQTEVMVTNDPEAAAELLYFTPTSGQYGARSTSFFPNSGVST